MIILRQNNLNLMHHLFSKKDILNVKWLVAEKLLQFCVAIFIIPKIFNVLGVADIGKLEFSKSLIGLLIPILFLGLSVICIRELVFNPTQKHRIIGTAFVLRFMSSIIVIGGLSVYVYFTQDSNISILLLIIGLGYFFKITDIFEYYLQALKKGKRLFFIKLITLTILLLAQYYGVTHHFTVYYFAALVAFDFFITGILYILIIRYNKLIDFKKLRFSWGTAKHLLHSAYPLILSNFIIAFYISIDEFFLKYFLGDTAVGNFATVQFLVIALTWNIGWGFILAIYPALAEVYQSQPKIYLKRMQMAYAFVIAFGIITGVLYFFIGDIIIDNFYSQQFQNTKVPLAIFSWAPLFIFIGVIYEKHLVNSNQLHKNIYRFLLGCVVNVLLCYLLIPKYKIVGAAIAVLISHVVANLGWILIDKESRVHFLKVLTTRF